MSVLWITTSAGSVELKHREMRHKLEKVETHEKYGQTNIGYQCFFIEFWLTKFFHGTLSLKLGSQIFQNNCPCGSASSLWEVNLACDRR